MASRVSIRTCSRVSMKHSQYEVLAYLCSYRVSMRSLRMLSPDASSLDALARLLPSAACRVLLQHRHHLAVSPLFRVLQGSHVVL
jgi:hypothetical protein